MIRNHFFDLKYCIWNIDPLKFANFKKNSPFDKELSMLYMHAYISAKKREICNQSSIGLAYSIKNNVLHRLPEYPEFNNLVHDDFIQAIDFFNLKFESLRIIRSWANRMHKDSSGVVHNHSIFDDNNKVIGLRRYVLIVYYRVPENSGNLIFLNPHKYLRKLDDENDRLIDQNFCAEDTLVIKPTDGMCILHDSRIPHTVSKHNSHKPRDVLIFDYECLEF